MEVAVGREALGDQAGADHHSVLLHQAAPGLVREDHSGDAGDGEGVGEAREQGQADDDDEGGAELVEHGSMPQTRWSAVTARSMTLMPMKGRTMPPSP